MTVYVDNAGIQASVANGSRTHTSRWSHLLTPAQMRLLEAVRAAGVLICDGKSRRPIDALAGFGLVVADTQTHRVAAMRGYRSVSVITIRPVRSAPSSPPIVRRCSCGATLRGAHLKCFACRSIARACLDCGQGFTGVSTRCRRCTRVDRQCDTCGRGFRGTNRICNICIATTRACSGCGTSFRGTTARCTSCHRTPKACVDCGTVFKGSAVSCSKCRRDAAHPDIRKARDIAQRNRRRAVRRSAEIAGPVPRSVYAALRAEPECVYCGGKVDHVDHVRPLARGGDEHEDNLVPSCERCNLSKGDRLLTEWDGARVARAALVSPKVAAELSRLTGIEDAA